MEKMIKVINDNLKNVLNGIKEHKSDLENTLDNIRNEMAIKVKEANAYKNEVENARSIVYSLENEIADLEKDLEELNAKFGAKDFKEILVAGNKEINAKILEKKSLIKEQGKVIISLTEKARVLKEALVDLRENKLNTEDNLEKTIILEGYYDYRIKEVISYSEEHPEELETYKEEVPQDELNIQEDIDISSVIDGSIFEEIDEISFGEPDQDLLNRVLSNPSDIPTYEKKSNEPLAIEISAADQLDNMINEANSFVEEKNITIPNEQEEIQEEDIKPNMVEEIEAPVEEVINTEIEEELATSIEPEVTPSLDIQGLEEELAISDDVAIPNVETEDDSIEIDFEDEGVKEDSIEIETKDEEVKDNSIEIELEDNEDEDDSEDDSIHIEIDDDEVKDDSIDITIENEEASPIEIALENEEVKDDSIDIEIEDEEFKDDSIDIEIEDSQMDNIVINPGEQDINAISESIQEELKESVHVNTERDIEKLLLLIQKTDADQEDIDLVYKYLAKVNVDKFEQVLMTSDDNSLTANLSKAIEDYDDVIAGALGLSKKAEDILKKTATDEELRIMNTLPDVVVANYEEVKNLNVDNLEECITKHPHRFTMTHSKFHEILDKYDTEDLIRCINKNAAVIDKL